MTQTQLLVALHEMIEMIRRTYLCVHLFHVFKVCCRLSPTLMLRETGREEHLSDTSSNRKSCTSILFVWLAEMLVTSIS